ncbi:hypothetical protein EJ02DRAFT_483746 [Clathrospora elynae]|uniref:Uncharacterized protein n=1 Tax=Clathrospora elynae TaxID=706981 RepID=A0A6A5S8D6_9PLEO|nr:hypothetical protein EJ02DRAFT_483746 [Clathrospora elynae]
MASTFPYATCSSSPPKSVHLVFQHRFDANNSCAASVIRSSMGVVAEAKAPIEMLLKPSTENNRFRYNSQTFGMIHSTTPAMLPTTPSNQLPTTLTNMYQPPLSSEDQEMPGSENPRNDLPLQDQNSASVSDQNSVAETTYTPSNESLQTAVLTSRATMRHTYAPRSSQALNVGPRAAGATFISPRLSSIHEYYRNKGNE